MGKLHELARSATLWYNRGPGWCAPGGASAVRTAAPPVRRRVSRMATKWVNVEAIGSYFQSLSDPRHSRNRKHLLVDVVVIAVCALVCGSDGPTAIHRWATERRDWLKQFLTLPHGIPSRDCIRRLLMALKPEAFQKCFQDWIRHAIRTEEGGPARLVAIDGKTNRRSHDAAAG